MQFKNPTEKTLAEKVYYLAGQMSGLSQFNIPEFYRIATKLRQMGYKIKNPAEEDSDELRHRALQSLDGNKLDLTAHQSWGSIMGRDVEIVLDGVDGIILFSNWTNSPGARIEAFCAYVAGHEIKTFDEGTDGTLVVVDLDSHLVREGILG